MNAYLLISSVCAAVTFAPPILPFTEIGDEKMQTIGKHMVEAKEITSEDFKVFLQLDHIRWKYEQMREQFYNSAKNANAETVIYMKDLGKIFDKIDSTLDAQREAELQQRRKQQEEIEKNETPIVGKSA